MRIFEILWVTAATISSVMGIVKVIRGQSATEYTYLFLVALLCVAMFYIKRGSRRWLLKREASAK
jgi:hypothetical protein